MAHIPTGPWTVNGSFIRDSRSDEICLMGTRNGNYDERDDIARLLAAAPDLYEALVNIEAGAAMLATQVTNPTPLLALRKLAADALAKARGKQ